MDKDLAISQPFLGQIASSWARWKEGIELFPYSTSFSKLAEKWRLNGGAMVQNALEGAFGAMTPSFLYRFSFS